MMKKSICLILVVVLLCGMVGTVSAYKFPNSFWPVNDKYVKALNSKDNAGIIQYGIESINLLEKEPVNTQTTDALGARYEQVAVAYENLGMYRESVPYFQKLLQLQYNDSSVTYGQIKLNTLRVQQYSSNLSLYTDGGTATHFGARGEKKSGVLYGACINGMVRPEIPNESMILVYQELGDYSTIDFNKLMLKEARESGLAVELALNCPQEGYNISNITNYASFLYMLSDVIKEYSDVVIYLRFAAEFDAWGNKNTPYEFVQAYRYVSDIFRNSNPNVAMVWSPTVAPAWNVNINDYYPGDQYVDWVGVSLYASPHYQGNINATQMDEVYFKKGKNSDPVLALREFVEAYGNRKPIMISECGCGHHVSATGENTTDFAVNYLEQYFGYLPMVYPQVKLMAYFDHQVYRDVDDYRLSSNPALKQTYLNYVKGGVFAQDSFMDEADTIYRPIENSTYVNAVFPVSAYAHLYNEKVQSVTYYIDGEWVATETRPPFTAYIDATKYQNGKHVLSAVAQGTATNTSQSYEIQIGLADDKTVSVYVADEKVEFDQNPVIYNDRTLVPMRKIFEALGATVSWDEATQTVTGVRGDRTVKLSIGSSVMDVNGQSYMLDITPILLNGRTLVPARAIAEGLGLNVGWNEESYSVIIASNE
ncbi:MAG: hypothetical protein IJE10_01755 [Clostridia bacterium]|nr:hypothetical protein [Clostridia bacterium]